MWAIAIGYIMQIVVQNALCLPSEEFIIYVPLCTDLLKSQPFNPDLLNRDISNISCYTSVEDVIRECRHKFPSLETTEILLLDTGKLINGIRSDEFACINNPSNISNDDHFEANVEKDTEVTKSLLANTPDGCKFKRISEPDKCLSQNDWLNIAIFNCENINMTLKERILTDSCGRNTFKSMEFVCCVERRLVVRKPHNVDDYDSLESDVFVQPPHPDLIGDLVVGNPNKWIPDVEWESEESASNELNDDSMEYMISPIEQVQRKIYGFLYKDIISLPLDSQKQVVDDILKLRDLYTYKQYLIDQHEDESTNILLKKYIRVSTGHAARMMRKISEKLQRDINHVIENVPLTGYEMVKERIVNLLQILYKEKALIVSMLNALANNEKEDKKHLTLSLQNVNKRIRVAKDSLYNNPTIRDLTSDLIDDLDKIFSNVSDEADKFIKRNYKSSKSDEHKKELVQNKQFSIEWKNKNLSMFTVFLLCGIVGILAISCLFLINYYCVSCKSVNGQTKTNQSCSKLYEKIKKASWFFKGRRPEDPLYKRVKSMECI